jgi:hypothetical protein
VNQVKFKGSRDSTEIFKNGAPPWSSRPETGKLFIFTCRFQKGIIAHTLNPLYPGFHMADAGGERPLAVGLQAG